MDEEAARGGGRHITEGEEDGEGGEPFIPVGSGRERDKKIQERAQR